jgi:hypothetical protein
MYLHVYVYRMLFTINSINKLVLIMKVQCDFCEAETEFLCIIYTSYRL